MSTLPASKSVLAPMQILLRHPDPSVVTWAFEGAAYSIPSTVPNLNILFQGQKKATLVSHSRKPSTRKSATGDILIVRLCDKRGNEETKEAWPHWRWEACLKNVSADEGTTLLRLDVTRYRIFEGAVDSASQLALFRHLLVRGLQAVDPALEVTGGAWNWEDAMFRAAG